MNDPNEPHYPTQQELRDFRQSYILGYHPGDDNWPVRLCDECGIADRHWPHMTGNGLDPRVRAFPGELVYGVPMGTPK